MKRVIAVILVLCMALSLCACSSSGSGSASGEKVIKIGVFEPSSGDSASGGKKEILGMQYANIRDAHRHCGRRGRTRSSWSTATTAPPPTRLPPPLPQLVSEGVSMVLGSYGSGVSIAGGPTFGRRRHPRHRRHLHQPQRHRRQRLLLPHLLPGSLPGHRSGQLRHGQVRAPRPPTAWARRATSMTRA